jgi:squalene-associated FAD-dependent desaturase
VILGGGLAGLAAGVRLHEAGFAVTLTEKRSILGGRASSFNPPGDTEPIDNCQHVLLGCCTNLLDFFSRTNSLNNIKFYRRFNFLSDQGCASLAASMLPAPLHFLPSIMRFRHLSPRDRRLLVHAIVNIIRTPEPYPDAPFVDWLRAQHQSEAVIRNFWHAVMTSALNEDPARLSTRPAFHVIVDSFVKNRSGCHMGVPRVPLSHMYSASRMSEFMTVRLGTTVSSVKIKGDLMAGILLQDNERVEADYYVSAVPPHLLGTLFDEHVQREWSELKQWREIQWSPITGIHLWYDRQVMQMPHAAVVGKTIQWIFNKSAASEGKDNSGQYIQVVISASRSLLSLKREEILALAQRDLHEILPETRVAKLHRSVVVKVAESTPHFPPGSDGQRSGPLTPYRNFFLAGDWTATGWPPTMEGAVRSGYRAAECVTEAAGIGRTFLVPDLPTSTLARLLLA